MTNEAVWRHVKAALAGTFQLSQSSYGPLTPSNKGWADSKAGESNATTPGSTQLTKAAKWTDGEQTAAEVEIQAAYAPNQQMDFALCSGYQRLHAERQFRGSQPGQGV